MAAQIIQHPAAKVYFDLPRSWRPFASAPGIAAPKLWICTTCKISLVLRSKPVCFQCGRPMKAGK